MGVEGSLPIVSRCDPERDGMCAGVDFGVDSCFLGASKRLEMSGSGYQSFQEIC